MVSFHGSYIPLQGVDKILDAAKLLKQDRNIRFRLIGPQKMINALQPEIEKESLNVEMIPWLSTEELNEKLNEADIVLGIFGDTPKTDRVVPNKLFQGVAIKKPVITKDTPAVRELFSEQEVYLIKNHPEAIANAIRRLYEHDEERSLFAERGYKKYLDKFTEKSLGKKLCGFIRKV